MGAVSGAFNYMAQDQNRQAQKNENALNRQFSREMYELQRDDYLKNYPELQKIQADTQFNLWKNQFTTEANYNNTSNQVVRDLVAGVNPAGQSGLVTGSAVNMPASGSVSPPPQIQGSPLGGSISGIPNIFQGSEIGSLLKQYGSFRKDMADADVSRKTLDKMDAEMDKLFAEKDLIDSQRFYQEIKNGIYQVLGYKKETVDIMNKVKQSYEFQAQGDYYKAAELMAGAQKDLFDSEKAINEEKKPFVAKLMQSQIDEYRSETRKNLALADQAIAEKDLKETQKTWQEFENQLKSQEVKPDVLKLRFDALINEAEAKRQISRSAAQSARLEADRIGSILESRGTSAVYKYIDDLFEQVKRKMPFTGNVNIGASSSSSHSDVNVHKD